MQKDPDDKTEFVASPLSSPRVPGVGATLADRYRLDSEVGRGGMGVVFRARDLELKRDVAVKILGAHWLDSKGRERLLREARAAAALNHPHVVTVYDVGEHEGAPYVVMELVKGTTLAAAGDLALRDVLELTLQLCDALAHAHEHGLVHRDLKPDNVLIGEERGRRTVKLADLGIAVSIQNRQVSEEGVITGTVSYMAPEQALGHRVDARADLYSLGVLLYERAARRLPFEGENPIAVLSQHIHAPVVPPRVYAPGIDPRLEQLILRLLAKSPEERYTSSSEVADAIRELLPAISRPSRAEATGDASGAAAGAATGDATDDVSGAATGEATEGVTEILPSDAAGLGPSTLTSADRLVLGLGGLIRGRLVGREKELTDLRELWRLALQKQGQLVLISGEPGAGKTRLAREIAVIARVDGAPVLSGGCYEYEASTPYLPFVEAIRSWVHSETDDGALAAALGPSASALARLAPEIESRLGPFPPAPQLSAADERLRFFDNVARFTGALAGPRGAVLALDDLHWADEGTIALLHYLRRQLKDERVLFLGTYREIELDRARPLARALIDWNRERIASRIQLQRLTREETGRLLATLLGQESVPDDLIHAVYRETEGNAFFIEEVVKSLIEQGGIVRQAEGWELAGLEHLEIPQSVKTAIGARLERVGETCIEVLRTAAVLGKDFEFDHLAAVSQKPEEDLLDAMDEATTHQLIFPRSGQSFVFGHDKIREVLYEEMNPIRRRRLHLRVAQGLLARYEEEDRRSSRHGSSKSVSRATAGGTRPGSMLGIDQILGDGPPGGPAGPDSAAVREPRRSRPGTSRVSQADLAFHFIEAGEHEAAIEHSMKAAAEASAVFAFEAALERYENALESALALGSENRVAEIESKMAETCWANGRSMDTARYGESALARQVLSTVERFRLTLIVAASYATTGNPRGRELISRILAEADPRTHPSIRADALMILGRFEHLAGKYREAIARYEEALALGEPTGDSFHLGYTYSFLAGGYQHLAEMPKSIEWAERCVQYGRERGDLEAVCMGLEFLGEDRAGQGRWRDSFDLANREIEIAGRIQARERLAWATFVRGVAAGGLGDLEEAVRTLRAADALADSIEERRLQVMVENFLAGILASRGELEEAEATLATAAKRARGVGLSVLTSDLLRARAQVLRIEGRWPEILQAIQETRELLGDTEEQALWCFIHHLEVEALLETGRLEEAEVSMARGAELAETADAPALRGFVTGFRGWLRHLRRDPAGAIEDLSAAIETFEKIEFLLPLAQMRVMRSRVFEALGRAEEAAADLAAARELLERSGARGEMALLKLTV
jgi:tetratricopeptide (TPR) repeat protein